MDSTVSNIRLDIKYMKQAAYLVLDHQTHHQEELAHSGKEPTQIAVDWQGED